MATFKKEYPDLVESVITECDIYSSVGKRFHTDRALWDTGADTSNAEKKLLFSSALPQKAELIYNCVADIDGPCQSSFVQKGCLFFMPTWFYR